MTTNKGERLYEDRGDECIGVASKGEILTNLQCVDPWQDKIPI